MTVDPERRVRALEEAEAALREAKAQIEDLGRRRQEALAAVAAVESEIKEVLPGARRVMSATRLAGLLVVSRQTLYAWLEGR